MKITEIEAELAKLVIRASLRELLEIAQGRRYEEEDVPLPMPAPKPQPRKPAPLPARLSRPMVVRPDGSLAPAD